VAKAFVDEGAILALAARTKTNVDARAAELSQLGARVLPLAVDLTSETEVAGAIDRIIENYGRIDILVNLAGGLTRYKPVIDHTLDDWQQELANNLLSTFLCSRAVLPRMRASGGGTIINFTRAGAAQANMAAYNCAKAGIEALTRTLALEARDADIRVNAIAPGLVDTESNIAMMKPQDLTRWTKRDDIARSVVFLASDASAGVTGQVLAVTGWGI
jgi:NAD(P)-dependent dehydrogenase (short-subunit alcohol dehydrogenase family)